MKLIFLHLSDMHFKNKNSYSKDNVDNIVTSLRQHCIGSAGLIIILSGDLTHSGYYFETKEVECFINDLRDKILQKYHFEDISILAVPGNHDMNLKVGQLSSEALDKIKNDGIYQHSLQDELKKGENGINLCRTYGCLLEQGSLISIKHISFGEVSLRFNLINTAPFSLSDKDKGFHYLSDADMDKLLEKSEDQFNFTIMHHPHQFFEWSVCNRLEENLISGSDAIFVGHEHFSKYRALSGEDSTVNIYSAGMLCNAGNWDNSEFYIGELDTDNREYNLTRYKWSLEDEIYISTSLNKKKLGNSKTNNLGIHVNSEYIKWLLSDVKYEISSNLLDYYVFPLLEEESKKDDYRNEEISSEDKFIEKLEQSRRVFLIGNAGSGKTITGKFIFDYYSDKKTILFINGDKFRDKNFDRVIRGQFEDTFSKIPSQFERFLQADSDDKIVVVDDIHLVPEKIQQNLFRYLDDHFGIVLVMAKAEIELDIFERLKQRLYTENYLYYRIRSFYADKREQLIRKIVNLKIEQEETRERQISIICDTLAKHKYPFIWNAEFVTQFTKYSCDTIGVSMTNDGDTFSKVFEHNLTSLLKPHAGKLKIDKYFFILGKIAYEIHVSPMDDKKYPISLEDICGIIRTYNLDYNSDVDPNQFVNAVISSNIFKKYEKGYIFSERNYLAYFVAREIKQKIHVNGDASEFQKALDFACFGINADVILFVTYISDNPNIIKWIMDKADEYVEKWEEFTLSPVSIPYLSDVKQLKVLPVTDDDRAEHEQHVIENEKKVEKTKALINPADIYSYEEGELGLVDEMVRSISTMIILSRTLPSFEYILEAKDKERCVKLIYSLPLRIFNLWALEIEKHKEELVSEIKKMFELQQFEEREYRRSKYPIADSDAIWLLRSESVLLLLELMNSAMSNATKLDTMRYVDEFHYCEKMTYNIEHLMAQDRIDNPDLFCKEAVDLIRKTKAYLEKILVRNVTRHYMVTSKKLDWGKKQMLNSKVFDSQIESRTLVIEQERNKRR